MRYVRYAFTVLIAVLLVGAFGAYVLLRLSLPQLDGSRTLPGLDADVSVARDALGVPDIRGASRTDVVRALGFVHGQERFFQMDVFRRLAAGELAALAGPAALEMDRRHRPHRFRHFAARSLGELPQEDRMLLEAYADGVNAGLDALSVRPWEYLLLASRAEAWKPEDSLLMVYLMHLLLQGELVEFELFAADIAERMPGELHAFLFQDGRPWETPLIGESMHVLAVPDESVWPERPAGDPGTRDEPSGSRTAGWRFGRSMNASNAWVVSGEHTKSGYPILANDMHLELIVPNMWFRASLRYPAAGEDVRVHGLTLPGLPLVLAGENGRIAWGFTNSNISGQVLIRLPDAASSGEDSFPPITPHAELIHVKGSDPEEIHYEWSRFGRIARPGLISRWVAYEPDTINLKLLDLDTARTVHEAVSIANRTGAPVQNFLVGDSAGNIGWTLMGTLPRQPAGLNAGPIVWDDSESWNGVLAPDAYPQRINPESGLLWSANHRKGDTPLLKSGAYPPGARSFQIRERLLSLRESTPQDHLAIQLDSESPFLRRWQELLLRVIDQASSVGGGRHQALREVVAGWDGSASADSAAYLWIRLFRDDVYQHVLRRVLPNAEELLADLDVREPGPARVVFEEPVWQIVHEQPPFLVHPDFPSWDRELLSRVDAIVADRPGDPGAYVWGDENRAVIRHPLSDALPLLGRWVDMPDAPMDGDFEVPRASRTRFSASNRTVIELADGFEGIFHMPSGQAGHPLSPYYGAGHEDWIDGRPTAFQPGEVRSVLELRPDS